MSLSKTINKVIFLQKIFRFAGCTVKDLVIINFVCKDFEETMQAHHTFNLVLYDNIIKQQQYEDYFPKRSVWLLEAAPAWIVYQWTIVNENDENQRELLKAFLLNQAKNGNNRILLRERWRVKNEDPSTTRELLSHILDSSIKLGIVNELLQICSDAQNCIMQAVLRKLPADSLRLLIESCARHGLAVKKMLEQKDDIDASCIMLAVRYQLPYDSFKFLIESCVRYGLDVKRMFEEKDRNGYHCIMLAARFQFPVDCFKLLIETCVQHGLEVKKMLEEKNNFDWNSIMIASRHQCHIDSFKFLIGTCVQHGVDMTEMMEHQDPEKCTSLSFAALHRLSVDSFKLLIAHFPSDESFRMTLATKNSLQQRAIEYATEEAKAFLEDPDCWKKCCEWRKQEVL